MDYKEILKTAAQIFVVALVVGFISLLMFGSFGMLVALALVALVYMYLLLPESNSTWYKPLIKAGITLITATCVGFLVINVGLTLTILFFLALSAAFAGFVWFAYIASEKQPERQATTVPQEEFKFIMAGETLIQVLPNLKKAGLDINGKVTREKNRMQPVYLNPFFSLLKRWFGIYWVSIFWPLRKIYTYKIDKYRLVQESQLPPNHRTRDLVSVEPNVEVNTLRRFIPRPLYIGGVELKDRWKVNVVVMTEYETIVPRIAIFDLKGKFFPLLDAAIEAAVNDVVNAYAGYVDIIGKPTGKGSPFSDVILNSITPPQVNSLADRLEETVGIRPVQCYLVRVDLPEDAKAKDEAASAAEVEKLKGQGVINAAQAQATAIERLADAHARTFTKAVEALTKLNVDANVAAQQVSKVMGLREVAGPTSRITAYAEAGTSAMVGLNTTMPQPTTPPAQPPATTPPTATT